MKNKNSSAIKTRFLLVLAFLAGTLTTVYSQMLGDVNNDGNIDIVDALMTARYSVGITPPGFNYSPADVNLDGTIDIVDALLIAQYYVGVIGSLPPGMETIPPHRDNPFEKTPWYVDPVWAEMAITGGGEAVAYNNTGIWLTTIGAIHDGMGVRGHLDEAVDQGAGMIMFVLDYLLDCSWEGPEYDAPQYLDKLFGRYSSEYIDPLAAIFSDPKYNDLNIVCIIEPGTLPNLITNIDLPFCSEMNGIEGYVGTIQYALNQFKRVPNVYSYLSIGFAGWLGWEHNFNESTKLYANLLAGTNHGFNSISGLAVNVANYVPLEEPFLQDPFREIGKYPIWSADFYEWNHYLAELEYALAIHSRMVELGLPGNTGMLIDTSRNGWGGPDRPTGPSDSNDLNTFVNESRIDRRYHRDNWCNQPGGIGERPRANPHSNIDAYVWIKPPGISDGTSNPNFPIDPIDPNLTYKLPCAIVTNWNNPYYSSHTIEAPHKGRWNQLHFDILLENAYPPLEPEVVLTGSSSCTAVAAGASSRASSNEGNECVEYSYDPGTKMLFLKHLNAEYNCCLDAIVSDSMIYDNFISITEQALSETPCRCLCLYDSDYKVSNILPEVYTIEIVRSEGIIYKPLTFTINLRETQVGFFCKPGE